MTDDTTAYVRPARPDWRHRAEHVIDRVRTFYDALWDLMPAIAAFAALIWCINTFGPH